MATHVFGEVEIAAIGGGFPVKVVNNSAPWGTAVVHRAIAWPDNRPIRRALCGAKPKSSWRLESDDSRRKDCHRCYYLSGERATR